MASGILPVGIEIQPRWWFALVVLGLRGWVRMGLPLTVQTVERMVAQGTRWRMRPGDPWRTW